jgi:hypothetical protein
MKKSFKITIYILSLIILVLGAALLFTRKATVGYGFVLLLFAIIGVLVWKAFIKDANSKIKESEKTIGDLRKTVDELTQNLSEINQSKLNTFEIAPILNLAVLNVKTSMIRTRVRENDDYFNFYGAMKVDIEAQYGIELENVLAKYDRDSNTLYLANFKPGFISTSKREAKWLIKQSCQKAIKPLVGSKPVSITPVYNKAARLYADEKGEEFRVELEEELNGRTIAEFEWLQQPLLNQMTSMMKNLLQIPSAKVVTLDAPQDDFIPLKQMNRINALNE